MYSTPSDAEAAFYTAIEDKNIQAMQDIWLDSEHIICIHPMGARLQGREQVIQSWQQIFTNDTSLKFSLNDLDQQLSDKLAVHILHEHIRPSSAPDKVTIVETTNAYKLTDDGWRMILHHASLSPKTVDERDDLKKEKQPTTLH